VDVFNGELAMNATTHTTADERPVTISAERVQLHGTLSVPRGAKGIVLFAHGSGSSRFSSRNQYVASVLQQANIATLLFDLLDEREADDRQKVFDVYLLADRLKTAAAWVQKQEQVGTLPLGYFGASTGAAAALVAAAAQGKIVKAVVSRGGRPDLAADALSSVQSPTLLIVGGDDEPVVELNRRALSQLGCEKQLKIVPGATHLFSETGALEQVAYLASQWFQLHLAFIS
jgi:putative phosphoribosyl transferase